jgi:hypothetical protein
VSFSKVKHTVDLRKYLDYISDAMKVKAKYNEDIIQSEGLWQAPKGETFASWMSSTSAIDMVEMCFSDNRRILTTDWL